MAAPKKKTSAKKKTPTTTKTPPTTKKTTTKTPPTTKKTFWFHSPEHLATYMQQSVESSVLERPPKEVEKCFGVVDKDGVETMCVGYQSRTTTFNTTTFKTGHEEEVNRLVSRTECEMCPSTEPAKAGGKCPGLRCFKECVGPKQTLDKGYCTGMGICSNCNKTYNALKKKRDRNQREKLAKKMGLEFNHDAFAKKEVNPLPTPRELHPYFIADYTCEMCNRLFVAKSQLSAPAKYNGEEGDVVDTLGDYLLLKNNSDKPEYRRKVYKGIKRGISSLFGRNDDEDGAQAVCDDCCGRIGGTLAVAFRTHLVLDNEPEKLVEIGANSLQNVKFDDLKGEPIEMEIGRAWKDGEASNELRAWDSSDFLKHYFPADFLKDCDYFPAGILERGPVRLIFQFQRESHSTARNSSLIDYCADLAASLARLKYKDTGDSLVFPGSWVGGVPFPCFICPDTCLRTGPMRGSLLARTQKHKKQVDKDVPGFKELLDSVNVALRGLHGESQISILINSPADLTSSALNLLAVLQMIEEPARVHVVWKVFDAKERAGGTVCVRDLLYFLRNRVNFDKFQESDVRFDAVKSACQNATAAAKFFGILWRESTKSLRNTGASVDVNEKGRKRRFENFPIEQNYGVMLSQPQGNPGPSQEEQDIAGADSQSNTDEISRAKLNKTHTFLLSWKQTPIKRQREGLEGEWFTKNQLIGVKRRGEWCGESDPISPHKKRTSLGNFSPLLKKKK